MKKEYVGPPTDIWAAGILFYAMLCGQFPFRGQTDKELYKKIARGQFQFPEHVSREAVSFINRMLVVNPAGRLTAQQLLSDPYMNLAKQSPMQSTTEHFLSTNESSGLTQNHLQNSGKVVDKTTTVGSL